MMNNLSLFLSRFFSMMSPIVLQCDAPDMPIHTKQTEPSVDAMYNYSTPITYEYETGFELLTGDLQRSCTENRHWDGSEPVCRGMYVVFTEPTGNLFFLMKLFVLMH